MKDPRSILAPTTALLGLAILASFQNPGQTGGTKPAGTKPAANPPAHAPTQDPLSSQTLNLLQADRVVGMELSDSAGAPLGRVQDLVLNADGSVGFVVIQSSAGGQAKLYPISWQSLQFQTGTPGAATPPGSMGGKLMTNFTKDRLDSAPSFTSDQWPKEGADAIFTEADAFYGKSSASHAPASRPGDKDARPQDASMRTPVRFRSSTLGSMVITDASGAPLGTLGQVVVDPSGGRAAYASVRLTEGRVIAVPWTLLKTSPDHKDQLQLSFPQDKLMTAPEFLSGEENWKQMSDPLWVGRVYSHYSVQPYWQSKSAQPMTPPADAGKQPPPKDQQPPKDQKPPSQKPPSGG